jgi:arylsulfatase A-like enzyme
MLAESSQSSSTLPGVCSATRVGEPAPPNIVVVVFDDLGLDRLGFYGQSTTPATTPVLSGLASKGLVFMQAWANPVCGQPGP